MKSTFLGFKLFLLVSLIIPLYFSSLYAQGKNIKQSTSVSNNSDQPITHKVLMNKALNSFLQLMPFLRNSSTYQDQKNEKQILNLMQELQTVFQATKKQKMLQQEIFATNNMVIEDNLNTAIMAFESKNKKFSHQRLKETIQLCFHCHSQMPEEFTSSFSNGLNNLKRKDFASDGEYADYLFLIRNFKEAENFYKQVISDNIKKSEKDFDEEACKSALQQLLLLYLKIERDPQKSYQYLTEIKPSLLKTHKLLQLQINTWLQDTATWKNKTPAQLELTDNKSLLHFIKTVLDPILAKKSFQDREATLLLASGILSQYLFINPSDPDQAIALYYLGLAEKELNALSFYSLAESYFRDCITKHPEHSIAPKCYKEYEDSMVFGFTGSSGEHIPHDVQLDLKALKNLIQQHQKKSSINLKKK